MDDPEIDLLDTNEYTNDIRNAGYGLTEELSKFKFREHVEKKSIILGNDGNDGNDGNHGNDGNDGNCNGNNRDDGGDFNDILKTNPVIDEDGNTKETDSRRYVKITRTVININSIQREIYDTSETLEKNSETGLYTREVVDSDGNQVIQEYTTKILNDEFNAGPDDYYEPYFRRNNGDIGIIKYKYRYPSEYTIKLPRVFTNIKEVKMISSEIPNTLNSINKYNNLITIYIRDVVTKKRLLLKTGSSQFDYILFQLDNGNYTLEEIVKHIQNKTNELIKNISVEGITNLFTVTVNNNTGKISIKLNNPPGKKLEFHWRFWFKHDLDSKLPITKYGNLWYILGFNRPYEITTTGEDKYTTERTNIFNFGVNPFIKDIVDNDREEYHILKPFRVPDLTPNKYIFLAIEGLKTVTNIQNPDVTNLKNLDIFAKINLDVDPGKTTFDSFVSNPKIFSDVPLRKLERLKIKWVDYSGIPVDFGLRNHSFSLEITEYLDVLNSAHYSSQRGVIDYSSATRIRDVVE